MSFDQVERVRDRLTSERIKAKQHVQLEAEQAGLDEDAVAACVDAAMSAFDDFSDGRSWLTTDAAEQWDDLVASVIQGHAAP